MPKTDSAGACVQAQVKVRIQPCTSDTKSIQLPCMYRDNWSTSSLYRSSCRTWSRALGPVSSALSHWVLSKHLLGEEMNQCGWWADVWMDGPYIKMLMVGLWQRLEWGGGC